MVHPPPLSNSVRQTVNRLEWSVYEMDISCPFMLPYVDDSRQFTSHQSPPHLLHHCSKYSQYTPRPKLNVLWDINDIGHTMWTPCCLKWWWGLIISGGGGGSVILQWAKWVCIWDHSTTTTTATCRTIASQKSIYNSGRVHTLSVTQWRRAPGKSTDTL